MKILFIGGTGIISSGCLAPVIERGDELYLFNRGQSRRPIPPQAHVLHGDARNLQSLREVLKNDEFDAVVNWIAYTPEQVEQDIEFFRGRVGQYVFISSASAYQKPPESLPIRESTPLKNPYWQYSRNKIACEDRLTRAYREEDFPATIVRPSHTYDQTYIPLHGGYTVVDRMRRGKPVVIPGDGTSLWVLTHHSDFAIGFTGLLGNPRAVGEAYHITSDELLTWNRIYAIFAQAAGAKLKAVHLPAEMIAHFDPTWGDSQIGDKSHSVIFDNSKIKALVPEYKAVIPFHRGAQEIMDWYDADPARQVVNEGFNALLDQMVAAYERALALPAQADG